MTATTTHSDAVGASPASATQRQAIAQAIRPGGWAAAPPGGDHAQLRAGVSQVLTVGAQGPVDAAGRLLHHDDPVAQAALALSNLVAVIDAAEFALADLALVQVHVVAGRTGAGDVVDAIVEHLAAAGATPPLTVAVVSALLTPGAAVQIDALLVR